MAENEHKDGEKDGGENVDPLAAEFADDPVGLALAQSIRTNESLMQAVRYGIGQRTAAAAEGVDEYPTAVELLALKKLEQQIDNDKLYAEARRLTRDVG